jgi:ribosomal protein L25 (general stress protein Ctc)
MARRKQTRRKGARASPAAGRAPADVASDPTPDDQISYSALSLHQLFEQQARQMLDRTDLDEEQKQNVLVAMSCPCCGAGAMSFTVKLRR